jgi:hypothetical protein
VAARAKSAVVGSDALVTLQKIGRVLRVAEPARWFELAAGKEHLHLTARVCQMASRALTLGTPLGSAGHGMATEAPFHAGELIARGDLELLDRAVALPAGDVVIGV